MPSIVYTLRTLIMAVTAGQVPTASGSTIISLPAGPNGHAFKSVDILLTKAAGATLLTDAEIDTELARVIIRKDGREFINVVGLEWLDMMGFDRAITANKGIVPIRFGQYDARTEMGEDAAIFGTEDVDSLEIELIWGAAITVTKVEAVASVLPNEPLGDYHSYRRFTPSLNGTTGVVWDQLRLTADQLLASLHVKSSTMTAAKVELGDLTIRDGKIHFLNHELREYEKIPNAIWTHLDFTKTHRHGHALPLGSTVRLTADFSADPAGAVIMIAKVQEKHVRRTG